MTPQPARASLGMCAVCRLAWQSPTTWEDIGLPTPSSLPLKTGTKIPEPLCASVSPSCSSPKVVPG